MSRALDYIQLTKPTIMLLVIFTGATALSLEESLLSDPFMFILALVGLYLVGGSANALNQCLERKIDAKMTRTSARRPLPQGKISLAGAYVFSILIGLAGVALFLTLFNWLSAALALFTVLFYSLFYTLYLKPNTDQNIVIGGIAGAMAPVIAWAAASGEFSLTPILLFLVVFLWTPAHFWVLALFCKEDYLRVELPMLPITRGERSTLKWIVFYSVAVALASLSLAVTGAGAIYLLSALILGAILIQKSIAILKLRSKRNERRFFGYSILYLFGLFSAMMIDGAM
ncbi:MAG: heme o synthase [Candidatus Zixiibacteriota bacterium]